MAIKKNSVLNRYTVVIGFVFLVALAIVFCAFKIIFVEGEMWREFGLTLKKTDINVAPDRGNIYSSDGQLMASSIPQYYVYMDMKADHMTLDSSSRSQIRALSEALARKFGERSAKSYYDYIVRNMGKTSDLPLTKSKISYLDYKELKKFPFLKEGWNFSNKKMFQRKKPFGSLASRTIGDIYGDYEKGGKNGIELAYNKELVGKPGKTTRMRVRGRWENVNEVDPEAGMDIVSTIDISLQDIAEKALMDKLIEIDAQSGVAILMEVESGKVRACVNLDRISEGTYGEIKNRAVADEGEPGSTFKVASMMVALEDGVVSPDDTIDTGNGQFRYPGATMTDHNANKGGYHKITAAQAIWYSSNIGVSRIIYNNYNDKPEKFVEGLYKIGLNKEMNFEIPGAGKPKIRYPNKDNWSRTALPWMSIGYEVNIPPIYTLAFFNAIANDGEMIRPYFVESIRKNDEIIESFDTEIINSSICSNKTLKIIKKMLENVVEKGTAEVVKSDFVKIAGKTGTAQISQGAGGYKTGRTQHQVTFCGYFPADDPAYTCICQIRQPRKGYPSGGTMSGNVVKSIAEQTYAKTLRIKPKDVSFDSSAVYAPKVKDGLYKDLTITMDELDIKYKTQDKIVKDWVKAKLNHEEVEVSEVKTIQGLVPNVIGMSAKDAIFLLEKAGLRVNINGKGAVYKQSIQGGKKAIKGSTISLSFK